MIYYQKFFFFLKLKKSVVLREINSFKLNGRDLRIVRTHILDLLVSKKYATILKINYIKN